MATCHLTEEQVDWIQMKCIPAYCTCDAEIEYEFCVEHNEVVCAQAVHESCCHAARTLMAVYN